MKLWKPRWTWRAGELREREAILTDDAGKIVAAGPIASLESLPTARGAHTLEHHRGVLIPGLVAAHSHCFQVLLRGWGDHPRDFKDWVARCLYPLVQALDDESLEQAALLCFGQMLKAGITTVGEFHYVHNAPGGAPRGNELDSLVIGAARRAGIRVAFLRTLYTSKNRPGQERFAEDPERAAALTLDLARKFKTDPGVSILPAPHSLHGASVEAIKAGARVAGELGTRFHIHLAEQKDDVAYSIEKHGKSPLRALDALGVLDARAVLVHAIWLDEGERALLAERGAAVVSCPLTSLWLGDGVLDVTDLVRRGACVGLGTDMNTAPDVFAEMRAAEGLQRARLFRMGVIPNEAKVGAGSAAALLELGTRGGARALGLATGSLAVGEPLDAVILDHDDDSLAPANALGGEALLNAIVSAMHPASAVRHVLVAGELVVRDRELVSREAREAPERLARASWRTVARARRDA